MFFFHSSSIINKHHETKLLLPQQQQQQQQQQQRRALSSYYYLQDGGGDSTASVMTGTTVTTPVTLHPGDLPGDDGWARPLTTDAPLYRMVRTMTSMSSSPPPTTTTTATTIVVAQVHQPLIITLYYDPTTTSSTTSDDSSRRRRLPRRPHFYARMYGPTVLAGYHRRPSLQHQPQQQPPRTFSDNNNNNNDPSHFHDIVFYPHDVGEYYIEIVLTFSDTLDFTEYPSFDEQQGGESSSWLPGFEGHLIPGFPQRVSVVESNSHVVVSSSSQQKQQIQSTPCRANDILQHSKDLWEGAMVGRWKLIRKKNSPTIDTDLGLIMEYQPRTDCALQTAATVATAITSRHSCTNNTTTTRTTETNGITTIREESPPQQQQQQQQQQPSQRIHLILIGDSVMGMQHREMLKQQQQQQVNKHHELVQVSYIYAGGGLKASLSNITMHLSHILPTIHNNNNNNMHHTSTSPKFIVVFNSGMHDIMVLYNQIMGVTMSHETSSQYREQQHPSSYYRTFDYRHAMVALVNELQKQFAPYTTTTTTTTKAKNIRLIFQTTTASWPKWGNWGNHWPRHKIQPFLLSTHWAEYYNQIALDVLSSTHTALSSHHHPIDVMDAYWMTLARPDCREINPAKGRRAKLAHPGEQVIAAMVNILWTLVTDMIMITTTTMYDCDVLS